MTRVQSWIADLFSEHTFPPLKNKGLQGHFNFTIGTRLFIQTHG